jgi:hypothetical protein
MLIIAEVGDITPCKLRHRHIAHLWRRSDRARRAGSDLLRDGEHPSAGLQTADPRLQVGYTLG